jgi:DNA-binding NarL/FixJ family response regulator
MKKIGKILVVEDEPLIAEDILGFLHETGYTNVLMAYSAGDALELLGKDEFDFVFLDIDLNGEMDGVDLASYINAHQQIPFAFITSFSDKKTLEKVKLTYPVGYVVKPFKESDIFTTLEIGFSNFYNRSRSSDLKIDKINQKIPVALTPKEFEVLVKIVQGKSNYEISSELFVSLNTVKTHAKNLFVKLNVGSRTEAIHFTHTI